MGGRGGNSGGGGGAGGSGGGGAPRTREQIIRDNIEQALQTVRDTYHQQYEQALSQLGDKITPRQKQQLDMQMDHINDIIDNRIHDYIYNGPEGRQGHVRESAPFTRMQTDSSFVTDTNDGYYLRNRWGAQTAQIYRSFVYEYGKLNS